MPPLSDSPIQYHPSHVTAAASRILAAYLAHNKVSAVEAARLAVRVESLLAELVSGNAPAAAPQPAELEAAPRRARRAAPAKSPRSARPRRAGSERAEAQAAFDLVDGAETVTETPAGIAEVATAEPLPAPAEQIPPAPVEEVREEIDLLTGGPLPPATEPEYHAMPQAPVPVPAESSGAPTKKRKRPPRPASQRRAARVAAIEQLLVEGEEPPEGEG
ncbi:MAG TPA: hypothetical protein VL752_10800 [Acidisoma sp.]|uniref:hypothetical protein n=1 Tax=Acidisoma sp. TaxID=1872115 RepID=UPI002BFBE02A|nr:hypothetical protein [Acidisoma sp.]HTI01422.1 hypothetical protein [Acidisoma sp.]